jgi:hypothetical protein
MIGVELGAEIDGPKPTDGRHHDVFEYHAVGYPYPPQPGPIRARTISPTHLDRRAPSDRGEMLQERAEAEDALRCELSG